MSRQKTQKKPTHVHDKIRHNPQTALNISRYRKHFLDTQKRVRISHGKQVIGVRVFAVLQYLYITKYTRIDLYNVPLSILILHNSLIRIKGEVK